MNGRAEIAGAGFAGLAAAIALARTGWRVRVHERDDAPRSHGAGIYVHPFAQAVLRDLGAFDRVAATAFAPTRRTIVIDGTRRSVTETGGQVLTTTRAHLHAAVLATAIEAGVDVATRSPITGADPAGALLRGAERLEADLVIAADGVRATIAQQAGLPLTRRRHEDGITRILLDRAGLEGPEWDAIHDFYDYRIRPLRILYTPCGPDAFYVCLTAPAHDDEAAAVPIAVPLWARSFPMLAPTLARVGTRGRHDRYTTTTMPAWHRGHLAVIGDAAHAMPSALGQGAGVSMQNALHLARAIAAAPSVAEGLAAWEHEARPIVERWQHEAEHVASSRSLTSAVHPGEDFATERSIVAHAAPGADTMTLVPDAPWYRAILAAVATQQDGITDYVGRPWAQHFERVALRIIFRNPAATRPQIEAALLHDAFMDRGGNQPLLDALAIAPEAIEIIERTTPPPDADFFRDFSRIGPPECAIYLDYIRTLVASGHRPAIEMKLADIQDTIDACRLGATPLLAGQFHNRYEPSRKRLEAALTTLI